MESLNKVKELWQHRSLITSFAAIDLKIRYRNSVLGFLWTFLEPLLILTVLYFVFTNIFNSQIENFPLYILLGLILWNMFSRGTTMGMNSLVSRSSILTQIYFPREIPVISSAITSLYVIFFEMMVFIVFLIIFQFVPPITIIILPLIILLEFVLVLGTSFALSVLNAKFKDTQFIWLVVIQAGFFITPIFYKFEILPEFLQQILYFSPMVQIVEIAHNITLYGTLPQLEEVIVAISTSFVVLIIGYAIFKKMESKVVEEL